jgi:hypothetical protein
MAQCSCSSQVYCVTLPSVHKHTCASWTRSCKLLLLLNKQKLWNCFIRASVAQKCIPLPNTPSNLNAKWKAFKNLLSDETHLLCFYSFICGLFNCKYIRLYIVEQLDDQWHMNWTEFRSKRLCPNLSYYSGIFLEWQRKPREKSVSRRPVSQPIFKPLVSKHLSEALPVEPTRSVFAL